MKGGGCDGGVLYIYTLTFGRIIRIIGITAIGFRYNPDIIGIIR